MKTNERAPDEKHEMATRYPTASLDLATKLAKSETKWKREFNNIHI